MDKYRHDFNNHGYVVIDDLLDSNLIERWNTYLQEKEDCHWTQIIRNNHLEKEFQLVDEKKDILKSYNDALKDYNDGNFCFSFKRIKKPVGSSNIIDEMLCFVA